MRSVQVAVLMIGLLGALAVLANFGSAVALSPSALLYVLAGSGLLVLAAGAARGYKPALVCGSVLGALAVLIGIQVCLEAARGRYWGSPEIGVATGAAIALAGSFVAATLLRVALRGNSGAATLPWRAGDH